jgi:N6-adenosine-specific RNA methylase IME4
VHLGVGDLLLLVQAVQFQGDLALVAADAAHLYLWTTNAFMGEAHDVARAWGFQPKTILTWVKLKLHRLEVSMKTGYWYRSVTEHIVFGVRGSQRLLGPAVPTAYLLPRLPHSGPYLELFARRLRPGWDPWGNEIESTIQLADPGDVGLLPARGWDF